MNCERMANLSGVTQRRGTRALGGLGWVAFGLLWRDSGRSWGHYAMQSGTPNFGSVLGWSIELGCTMARGCTLKGTVCDQLESHPDDGLCWFWRLVAVLQTWSQPGGL